ncbi:MAG: response regulator [Anaerolineae bacterium]|nr:response regulator [Anaerolineae bacterium]
MTKILVIDDETILRQEITEWLTLEDYEVINAADGRAGVEAAFQHQPDLVISDVLMPHLDGYGVLLEMRSNPLTVDTPFIFLTARTAHEDMRQGMSLGADDYITKPFTRQELLEAIEIRLGKKAAQEEKHLREVGQWQQALEYEREQRLLKTKLIAMFSHDFRNPLTVIRSSNILMQKYADRMGDEQRQDHTNRIEASVQQLLQMLDDMLMIAQMETDNLDFRPEPLALSEFFQRIAGEFQTIYGKTHSIFYEAHFDDTSKADPRLLRQIASNLISNAVKYSSQGSQVHVVLDKSSDCWSLSVQDQGRGIPEEELDCMFEAFHRGSNVRDISGTGLGLAIVKQATDLHDGSVHLESQVDIGTTVSVTIPFC